MHIIKEYQPPTTVTLIRRDGAVWRFDSISAVVERFGLRWIYANVGEQLRVYSHTTWHHSAKVDRLGTAAFDDHSYPVRHYRDVDFILRDPLGVPLTYARINRSTWKRNRPNRYSSGRFAQWQGVGPVPGTGKSRRSKSKLRGRMGRHANAIRASETFNNEGEISARTRWVNTLWQDPWNDYAAERVDRSWKKYRKTQWR